MHNKIIKIIKQRKYKNIDHFLFKNTYFGQWETRPFTTMYSGPIIYKGSLLVFWKHTTISHNCVCSTPTLTPSSLYSKYAELALVNVSEREQVISRDQQFGQRPYAEIIGQDDL